MPYTDDKTIGGNLERLRGDMSMDMLAAKMREKGYRWTKTTVFKVEHGDRQLRLQEAADVMECLGFVPGDSVSKLLYDPEDIKAEKLARSLLDIREMIIESFRSIISGYIKFDEWSKRSEVSGRIGDFGAVEKILDGAQIECNPHRIIEDLISIGAADVKEDSIDSPTFLQLKDFIEKIKKQHSKEFIAKAMTNTKKRSDSQ